MPSICFAIMLKNCDNTVVRESQKLSTIAHFQEDDTMEEECRESVSLLFVGSPLLDITATCNADIIQRYHLKEDGCIRATAEHDSLFQQLFDDPKNRVDAGGSAFNSAKVAQWMLGRKGRTAFVGCVGKDEYAERLRDDLEASFVDPLFVSLPECSTGICACLLSPDGKRSMCTRQGAAAMFAKDYLDEKSISSALRNANCIFVVGYFFSHSTEVIHSLANRCSSTQLFSLSLSAEYICKDFAKDILDVLPKVDILFGNEAEVKAFFTAIGVEGYLSSEHAASVIAQIKTSRPEPRIVLVTQGPDSVILANGRSQPRRFPVPAGVPVVDSVGCGDAFAGAFLAVYSLTRDADRAVKSGIQAAVQIVQVPGCELPPGKVITF